MVSNVSYKMRAFEYPSSKIGLGRIGVQCLQWAKRTLGTADRYLVTSKKLQSASDTLERKIISIQTRGYKLFDYSPDPMLLLKTSGEVIYMNKAAAYLAGLAKKDWVGKHFTQVELIDEESLPVAIMSLTRELKGENPPQPEIKVKTVEGEKTVEVRAQLIRKTPTSSPEAVLIIFRDVTERRLAEEKTKASEQKFREMFMMMREGVALCDLIFDKEGNIIDFIFRDINPSYEDQTGMKREAVLGKKLSEAFGITFKQFSDLYKIPALRKEIEKTGHAAVTEVYFDLLKRYFEISIIRQAEDRFMLVFSDITQRKQAQILSDEMKNVALKLSEAMDLEKVLAVSLESALAISGMKSGGVYLIEPATGDFVLHHHKGLSDKFIDLVKRMPKGSPQADLAMEGRTFYATGESMDNPTLAMLKEEGLKNVLVVPIKKEDRVIGCMNISSYEHPEITKFARDAVESITSQIGGAIEIKRLADELMKARDLADQRIRNMVHDLNNMLSGIIPLLDMALMSTGEGIARKHMLELYQNFGNLRNVISVLSFISKPMRLSAQPEQIFDAVRDGIRMAQDKLRYDTEANIELKADMYSPLPPVHLEKNRFALVIFNLILNAFDAIKEKGKVTVRTSTANIAAPTRTAIKGEIMPPDKYVVVSVADNGTGIENLDNLFVRGKTIKEKGSGIGLHLAHTTIKGHNGYILVDTKFGGENSGTTFSIYIPAAN